MSRGYPAPFQPALAAAPNDFTLALQFTGGGLTYPGAMTIDNAGNVFATNCPSCNGSASSDSIVGFSPAGAVITSGAGFTGNVHQPVAIAIDKYNGIWVANVASGAHGSQITKIDETGAIEYPPSATNYNGFPAAFNGTPAGIALVPVSNNGGGANAWVTDSAGATLVNIQYNGNILQTLTPAGLTRPGGIAADQFGNLFIAGTGSKNIVEYNGSAFTSLTAAA